MKKLLITYILLFVSVLTFGAAAEFTVKVSSSTVEVGERFQITFSINARGRDFAVPRFENFQAVSGPSYSQSAQVINGKTTQTTSLSYVLVAEKKRDIHDWTCSSNSEFERV